MQTIRYRCYTGALALFSLFVLAGGCHSYSRNASHPEVSTASISAGEVLAAKYCQACHILPDPSLLDANSWERGVLPNMGPRLGIFMHSGQGYPSFRTDRNLKNFYPSAPLLKPEEWQHIIDYYTATAPDSLPEQQRDHPVKEGLNLFETSGPAGGWTSYPPLSALGGSSEGAPPATCLVQVDRGKRPFTFLTADAITQRMVRWDSHLKPMDTVWMSGAAVHVDLQEDGMIACNIGMLNPNNGKYGKGQHIRLDGNGKMRRDSLPLFGELARPVQISGADLNGDGKRDYLVCEFGYQTGALSWMENKGDSQYTRHVIKAVPGAIKAIISDYNHDGLPDLWVLFAQGDEGIALFTNKGGGVFSEERVLRFPPSYGSSYFELADINGDGYSDIVYTCGDNADFSIVLKPYHGIYVFMNDGKNHFTRKYFYPMNGCYKAVARDFDGDGDLDIAAIAFFPDFKHQPDEGFVYLENEGGTAFQPYGLSAARVGRWLTMDAGDVDGDGKVDIILGNFSVAPGAGGSGADWKKGPAFLLLRNTGHKNAR